MKIFCIIIILLAIYLLVTTIRYIYTAKKENMEINEGEIIILILMIGALALGAYELWDAGPIPPEGLAFILFGLR